MSGQSESVLSPGKVVRGKGALTSIGEVAATLGKKAFIMGGKTALGKTEAIIREQLTNVGVEVVAVEWFGGECSYANSEKMQAQIKEHQADLVIVVGGGKAMDTGKMAAIGTGLPLITVPTIAATCAALAGVSVVYTDEGAFAAIESFDRCPEAIIVDTEVIMNAPIRWLAAGLGDTLAKWYEYRVSMMKAPHTGLTLGALANGKICYDLIERFGGEAIEAVQSGKHSLGLDAAVDAIILYAGTASMLGGETVRAAAAHAFYNALTIIPAAHAAGHGLTVGYGNLVLLALEGRSDEEIKEAIALAKRCGVPTTLKEIVTLSEEEKSKVADAALSNPDMKNMPFEMKKEMIFQAVDRVDSLGN